MRHGIVFMVLALSAAGCAGTPEQVRSGATRKMLESATVEAPLESIPEAAARLPRAKLGQREPPCEGCVEAVACEGDACGIWFRYLQERGVLEAQRQEGRVALRLVSGGDDAGSRVLLSLWRELDREVAENTVQRVAAGELRDWFTPRWVPSFGVVGTGSTDFFLGGMRAGMQRWHTSWLMTGHFAELQLGRELLAGPRPVLVSLALPQRVSFARYTPAVDRQEGFPRWAFYLQAAPVLANRPRGPLTAPGLQLSGRVGPGVYIPLGFGGAVGANLEVFVEKPLGTAPLFYGGSIGFGL